MSDTSVLQYPTGALEAVRDYRTVARHQVLFGAVDLPKKHVTRELDKVVVVLNQKLRGGCTGHGVAHGASYLRIKENGGRETFSGRFPYLRGRLLGNINQYPVEGARVLDVLKGWTRSGVPLESVCPNDGNEPHKVYTDPRRLTPAMYAAARPAIIRSFGAVDWMSSHELKRAIFEDGFVLMAGLVGDTWNNPGRDIIRAPREIAGGHLYLVYGYEETSEGLLLYVLNSWGAKWANNGRSRFLHLEHLPYLNEAYSVFDLPDDWMQMVKDLPSEQTFRHSFTTRLQYGYQGPEVRALQVALAIEGLFQFAPGDPDVYGPKTSKALKAFQERYQLADQATLDSIGGRYTGPATLQELTKLYAA